MDMVMAGSALYAVSKDDRLTYFSFWFGLWAFALGIYATAVSIKWEWRPVLKLTFMFALALIIPLVPIGSLVTFMIVALALFVYITLASKREAKDTNRANLDTSIHTLNSISESIRQDVSKLDGELSELHKDVRSLSTFILPHRRGGTLRYLLGLDNLNSKCVLIYSHLQSFGNLCQRAEDSKTKTELYDFNHTAPMARDEEPFSKLVEFSLTLSHNQTPVELMCSCRLRAKAQNGQIPEELKQNVIIIGDTTLNYACELAHEAARKRDWLVYDFQKRSSGPNEYGHDIEECYIYGVPGFEKLKQNYPPDAEIPRPAPRAPLTTYALLTKIPNPFAPEKDMIIAGGCRRSGQIGLTIALTDISRWNQRERELNLYGNDSFFQAVFRVAWRFEPDPEITAADVTLKDLHLLKFPRPQC